MTLPTVLKVLLVDDDEVDRMATVRALHDAEVRVDVREVDRGLETFAVLAAHAFHCVILDLRLPDCDGADLVRRARNAGMDLPIIVLTGYGDEEIAVDVMKAGATDYLPKAALTPDRLRLALESAFRVHRAEKFRDELLSVVSHDLRNPLSAILTSAAILKTLNVDPSNGQLLEKCVGTIQRSGDRMQRLIRDLLDLASIQAGRMNVSAEPYDLRTIIDESLEIHTPLAAAKSIELTFDMAFTRLLVCCDRDRVHQVLSNLIGNAIKFTGAGGQIAIEVAVHDAWAEVRVVDYGPGISEQDQQYVFERFWQAKRAGRVGVGLGLSIAEGIVKAHGGIIGVDSKIGEGSTFYFTLPLAEPARLALVKDAVGHP